MRDELPEDKSPSTDRERSNPDGIINLIRSWTNAQKAISSAGSKLLFADSKLAVASGLQIVVLAILAVILIVTAWCLLCALAVVVLMYLGLSIGLSIALLLVLQILLIGLVIWAINSSMSGLRFETSRSLLRQVRSEISPAEK